MKEEIKTLVESNRSMICWILDFNDQADSCFVCEQKGNGGYTTHIFTNGGKSRRVTGASFVIFDGALKHSNEKFIVTVIEDGIVVRMQSETMDEAVRCLLAGQNFHLESSSMVVDIIWEDKFTPVYNTGALISPIDGSDIGGKYQYGLVLHRQFRSMNFIPTANEWALRLSTVINMEDGKFPSVLQPKYFDICEQMAAQIATTIAPFIGVLVANNHRFVAIRVRIDTDNVTYDTAKWPGMEDEHFVWTVTLDDQIIPYLYNLCAILPSGFHVEMHMPIVSARSLPIGDL
uniref:Smad anchor for receptor activation-like C-terminal domain-containing protein n=1 Tax=Acrobeloides nanus TaxID=290746 RepID=A0A914CFU7_9BILA